MGLVFSSLMFYSFRVTFNVFVKYVSFQHFLSKIDQQSGSQKCLLLSKCMFCKLRALTSQGWTEIMNGSKRCLALRKPSFCSSFSSARQPRSEQSILELFSVSFFLPSDERVSLREFLPLYEWLRVLRSPHESFQKLLTKRIATDIRLGVIWKSYLLVTGWGFLFISHSFYLSSIFLFYPLFCLLSLYLSFF